jgi:hypothetical protein
MSNKFNLLAVISLYLAGTNVVYALSCKNGDSSCSTQSAADCANLGYSADNVDNCKHYLYCPFNLSYKTCVAFDNSKPEADCSDYPLTSCPSNGICEDCPNDSSYKKLTGCNSGYTLNTAGDGCVATTCASGYAKSADNCGTTGSKGWSLGTKDANGCGKCTEKYCSGSANYTSVDKCGSAGADGWNYSSCYYGDELRGTCSAKSCPSGSATSKTCSSGYNKVSTGSYSGNSLCYKCVQQKQTCFKTEAECKAGVLCRPGCFIACRYDSATKCYYGNEVCKQPGIGL